ncbi:dehydrogenase [Lewinellaceae bacterium SD302]|nr:dehydrogenase [Lewinellaceae bacterium SD302]
MIAYYAVLALTSLFLTLTGCDNSTTSYSQPEPGERIVLLGDNLCSRMQAFGHFETELHLRFPNQELFVRNMCDGGNTPGFRPRSGRATPWAFPGAEDFHPDRQRFHSEGHLETPDEWLTRLAPDHIIAFFGGASSFAGEAGAENFRAELSAFVKHTLAQQYRATKPVKLTLVSPIAFEDIESADEHYPDGKKENEHLELYTNIIQEVASEFDLPFIDLFHPSQLWYFEAQMTTDGLQLNEKGYQKLASYLGEAIFGGTIQAEQAERRDAVHAAVQDKNFFWHNDFKIPNGVHAYGVRYNPYGPDNYPDEFQKVRELTAIRDRAIWDAAQGEVIDLPKLDAQTHPLPPVETNYDTTENPTSYQYGDEALSNLSLPPGYRIELFASEEDFPELANPAQLSFDNQGRLWVATLESYPHYKPGAERPNDKLLILEDTDKDGKADKSTVWADGLSLPIGFEFAPEGVYVSQAPNLVLLSDTDGDDKADKKEIILSGFDDHDTHHAISAFCADPSGAIYMGEGIFLYSNLETPYGPQNASWSGFWRYSPQTRKMERTAQVDMPNPWGIAFDEWGQPFFAETSGTKVHWMTPSSIKPKYGKSTPRSADIIEEKARVRPTSGLEFVSSRHFPDEVQGDLLLCNVIGFLGIKQHRMLDNGADFTSRFRQDLLTGSDPNFRPVDLEFAPDGSLYLIDWHNVLIGHMQHNARDPLRDHVHGRIYRITYPGRPLVEPAKIAGAGIPQLLDNLKLPEYRSRYRTRRELRGRDADLVAAALSQWIKNLSPRDQNYEQHLTEALWVSWGINRIDERLLDQLLDARDFRARAAATRVIRYTHHRLENAKALFLRAALDEHPRVRTEAMIAASWLDEATGDEILTAVFEQAMDEPMTEWYSYAKAYLHNDTVAVDEVVLLPQHPEGEAYGSFMRGQEIYKRDGYCGTCHQMSGKGLAASGFPPLDGTRWANGDTERLIKLTLNGLYGPIEVLGKKYPGQVPMTPYGGMLNDREIADVLTFVRNAFSNRSSVIQPEEVARVRETTKDKEGFYSPEELLAAHPMEPEE